MKVAIVICTKDRPIHLRKCLLSIHDQKYPISEIIIVDSSSTSETDEFVHRLKNKNMPLIYIHSLKGLPMQRNLGISNIRSGPEIVCFFDDDVELDQYYLQNVVNKFESDKKKEIIGVCGNALNEKRRHLFDRFARKVFFITDNVSGKLLLSGDAGHVFSPEKDKNVSTLSGCNMCFRQEIYFEHNQRFDENLNDYAFMEDQDFSLRAGKFGRLVQVADAKLIHHVSSVSRPDHIQLFEMYTVNSFYLLKKNLSPSTVNYVCYFWRLTGKFVHALLLSIKSVSSKPLKGWLLGLCHINKLSRKMP